MTRRDLTLALVAPLVATAIATLGVARYHDLDQSSWRGASFGMFATYEYDQARVTVAFVEGDDGPEPLPVPDRLRELRDEATIIPGGDAPTRLAAELADASDEPVTVEVRGHQVETRDGHVSVSVRTIRRVQAP